MRKATFGTSADSEGTDQPAPPRSQNRAFAVRLHNHGPFYLLIYFLHVIRVLISLLGPGSYLFPYVLKNGFLVTFFSNTVYSTLKEVRLKSVSGLVFIR